MKKRGFENKQKASHFSNIPITGLMSDGDTLTLRCKFNFSYFCTQGNHGKAFSDLSKEEMEDLFQKLLDFCRAPLMHWQKQKHGISTTLAIYEKFPTMSDFTHPKHVPHDVHWGRFRLSKEVRLVGFVVPPDLSKAYHQKTNVLFDCNTFYIVFLDCNHGFYKSKNKAS
ncbi:hypothetical protein [Pararobbsia silviterrae]|uniref:hypothetical protein n=1 Tax=Pararobbsia silviterrae TaxID=1792498 RepID=UPI0011C3CBA7|nr:hypothetical protein [Pararobbsia silviterrae]